jgi:hypothetical protein
MKAAVKAQRCPRVTRWIACTFSQPELKTAARPTWLGLGLGLG